jgi:hypothetical protein
MVQQNVMNLIKKPNVLCSLEKYQDILKDSKLTTIRYEETLCYFLINVHA